MPRCPLCASAQITVISRHRCAFCSDCGARWVQEGSDRHPPRQQSASRDSLVRSVHSIDPDSPIRPLSPEPPPWPPPWPPPLPSPPSPLSPPLWPR
jgi:hypothetical protein